MTRVVIQSFGARGDGVAEIGGRKLFVPYTVPGDEVEIGEIEAGRARYDALLVPGKGRTQPICPHFGFCGGCQLQHLDAVTYAAFKRGLVVEALSFAGIEAEIAPLLDARGNGRRRTTLHAQKHGAGYIAQRSHDLYAIDTCPILVPALARAPAIAAAAFDAIGPCDVSLTATETGLDVVVRGKGQARRLLPMARTLARLTLNGELVLQNVIPAMRMGKALVELPPGSFLQATHAAEEALAGLVVSALAGRKSVVDLFSGVGPFALRLAETGRVAAFDSDRAGIEALLRAVRHTQGLKPVNAGSRDLFREPLVASELDAFDAAVFDPPRAGAEAQAREIAKSKLKTVVGVSCDPGTFARDAKILVEGGFRLASVTPVDQFAYSTHVEIVGVFQQ